MPRAPRKSSRLSSANGRRPGCGDDVVIIEDKKSRGRKQTRSRRKSLVSQHVSPIVISSDEESCPLFQSQHRSHNSRGSSAKDPLNDNTVHLSSSRNVNASVRSKGQQASVPVSTNESLTNPVVPAPFEHEQLCPDSTCDNFSDSGSDTDFYAVDYKDIREEVVASVTAFLKKTPEPEVSPSESTNTGSQTQHITVEDDRWSNSGEIAGDHDLSVSISQSELDSVPTPKVRRNRSLAANLSRLKAISARLKKDESKYRELNDSVQDVYWVDNEIDSIPALKLRLQFADKQMIITICEHNRFLEIYQQVARENGVSISDVLMSFKDKIVDMEATPKSLGITSFDLLDVGIIRCKPREAQSSSVESVPEDKNIIEVKLQSSGKRDVLVISFNKYDKLQFLMENYATLKNKPVSKFKFIFDGEKLQPDDTGDSLDFEGGECIDVYEV